MTFTSPEMPRSAASVSIPSMRGIVRSRITQRDRPETGAEDLERLDPVRGEEHAEAEMFEHAFRDDAHHLLVVDEQHRPAPLPPDGARGGFLDMFDRARRRGEDEPKSGALARLAADPDRSAVPPRDAENDGESEPPPGGLRREERIEYLLLRFLIHSASRIGYFEKYVSAFRQTLAMNHSVQTRTIALHRAGGYRNHAAFLPERLGSVDDEVHDDLLDLGSVRFDQGQVGCDIEPQLGFFRNRNGEQTRRFLDGARD